MSVLMSKELDDDVVKLKKGRIHSGLNVELLNREWKQIAEKLKISSEGNFSDIILEIEGKSVQNGIWKFLIKLVKIVNLFTIGYIVLPFIAFFNLFSDNITWFDRIFGFPLCWVAAFTLSEYQTPHSTLGYECSKFLPFEHRYVFYFYIFSIISFFVGSFLYDATCGKFKTVLDAYCPKCLIPSSKEIIEKIDEIGTQEVTSTERVDTPRIEHFDSSGQYTGFSREDRYKTTKKIVGVYEKTTTTKCRFCSHVYEVKKKIF